MQAALGIHSAKHSSSAVASLEALLKNGCEIPLTYDDKNGYGRRRSITLPTAADSPLPLGYLIAVLARGGRHEEAEQVLEAMLTNDSYVDLEYNLALIKSKKGREAPIEEMVDSANALADPDSMVGKYYKFYSNMLLAAQHIVGKNYKKAIVHAKQAAAVEGAAENVARVLLKRALVEKAICDERVTKHARPPASITRLPANTGGWLWDGSQADPPIETVEDAFPGIDYLPAAKVSANIPEFQKAYLLWNRPAIIGVGLIDGWQATTAWTKSSLTVSPGRGDIKVQATLTPYSELLDLGKPENMTLKAFVERHMDRKHPTFQSHSQQPYYVFDELPRGAKQDRGGKDKSTLFTLMKDYAVPTLLQAESFFTLSLLAHFYVGAKGSGAHLHAHVATFNALVYGRKHWYLIPPEYGVRDTYDEQHQPIEKFVAQGVADLRKKGIKVLEFVQQAGEIVFVPANWLHAVYNLEDSVGLSYQLGEPNAAFEWRETLANPVVGFHSRETLSQHAPL